MFEEKGTRLIKEPKSQGRGRKRSGRRRKELSPPRENANEEGEKESPRSRSLLLKEYPEKKR